ncbi:MAG: AAA family ATPase [Planctomycetes bacterium]|nr:AAA family ATPase [Planctomycetota bacterium]
MLERLYVDNFRCLVNFECRFSSKQLLLGPNGGGKTTVFNVLATLRDFCVGGLTPDNLFLGFTKTRWQDVPEQTFELDVRGNGGLYTFRLVIDSSAELPARPRVAKEEVFYSGRPLFRFAQGEVHLYNDQHEEKFKYPFDWFRSAFATVSERPEYQKLSWFKRWLANLLLVTPDPHQMLPYADREAPTPMPNLSNFAAWYRHIRLESDDQPLLKDLRDALPGFVSMDLKDAGLGNRFLVLTFSADTSPGQTGQNYAQYFSELSDGQRVLVGLYTVLHFALKPGACVLFDEPDNFIALREIEPWLEKVLERVEEQDSQAVLISHHPEFLNRLALPGGIVLDRPGGRHARVGPFTDPDQTGLSPAELVARGWEHE